MPFRKDKPEEKSQSEAVKAAQRLRMVEVKLAQKLAEAEAKAAMTMAKAEARAAKHLAKAEARELQKNFSGKRTKRAVCIDLLAEAKAERERRRKDPVKRAAWVSGFCISVMLLWVLKLEVDLAFQRSEYHRVAKLYGGIRIKHATLTNDMIADAAVEHKLEALDRLTTNRFLWAPVLNALQTIMVQDVQLIRLTGDQRFLQEAARTVGTGSHTTVVPAACVERISLYLQARDLSSNELSYLEYKDDIGDCDYFVKNLKRRHGFVLEGVLKPPAHGQLDPASQFTFFVLSSHFPDVRHSQ